MRDVYSFCNALHLHTEENRHDAQIKLYGVFRKQEVKTLINKIIEEKTFLVSCFNILSQ